MAAAAATVAAAASDLVVAESLLVRLVGASAANLILVPLEYFTWLRFSGLCTAAVIAYLYKISSLAHPARDSPCIQGGAVFRVLYGLFSTRLAHMVLGRIALTKEDEPQAEGGDFNTLVTTQGPPQMRVQLLPILGSLFGGNYAFLIWDAEDPQRRAIAVDPADPHVVLRAAEKEGLQVEVLLTTHWHFDHSAGNPILKRRLPQLEVVAGSADGGRTPAVTRRVRDGDELQCGRLTIRAHAVPGHTRGSVVYEVFSRAAPDAPHIAFLGDTLFCGGCGALFECSSNTLHGSLEALVSRLKPETLLYPGHEYSEMLLQMAVKRSPDNRAAIRKLAEVRSKRRNRAPSLPSTLAEELEYNPYLGSTPQQLAALCGAVDEGA